MSLWSGRFTSEPDQEVFDYGKSLSVDCRLVEDDITGSVAWAEALGRAKVLTPEDVRSITGGLEGHPGSSPRQSGHLQHGAGRGRA
jgi:argininosuccinate lyase